MLTPGEKSVAHGDTETLREERRKARDAAGQPPQHDRGGSMARLRGSCLAKTGLDAPRSQWDLDSYGPHVKLPYVRDWYRHMRDVQGWDSL